MGWIHAGTDGEGSYCMDDPIYAGKQIVRTAYKRAVQRAMMAVFPIVASLEDVPAPGQRWCWLWSVLNGSVLKYATFRSEDRDLKFSCRPIIAAGKILVRDLRRGKGGEYLLEEEELTALKKMIELCERLNLKFRESKLESSTRESLQQLAVWFDNWQPC